MKKGVFMAVIMKEYDLYLLIQSNAYYIYRLQSSRRAPVLLPKTSKTFILTS